MSAADEADMRARIAANMRGLRLQLGLSQAELAELMHISRSRISIFENGSQDPQLASIMRFADALGYKVEIHLVPKEGR